jgi:hypothetical protein
MKLAAKQFAGIRKKAARHTTEVDAFKHRFGAIGRNLDIGKGGIEAKPAVLIGQPQGCRHGHGNAPGIVEHQIDIFKARAETPDITISG